jgi:hypothetical protein
MANMPIPAPQHLRTIFVAVKMIQTIQTARQQRGNNNNHMTAADLERITLQTIERREVERNRRRQHYAKRKMLTYQRQQARDAVYTDYLHPENPTFDDKYFQRVFCVTKTIFQSLLEFCATNNPYFAPRPDALGHMSIDPAVKILFCLKIMAYGFSPSAFQDYFQMGLTTARECCIKFTDLMSISNNTLSSKLHLLHLEKHGIQGMVGSLDCMHVAWKNCPIRDVLRKEYSLVLTLNLE